MQCCRSCFSTQVGPWSRAPISSGVVILPIARYHLLPRSCLCDGSTRTVEVFCDSDLLLAIKHGAESNDEIIHWVCYVTLSA